MIGRQDRRSWRPRLPLLRPGRKTARRRVKRSERQQWKRATRLATTFA